MDHTESCTAIDDLMFALADWAIKFDISLAALSALLSILKVHHPSLPKDGWILLKTKATYYIITLSGGMSE